MIPSEKLIIIPPTINLRLITIGKEAKMPTKISKIILNEIPKIPPIKEIKHA